MRIQSYAQDNRVSVNDKVIGTDGDNNNKTKNFGIQGISEYILSQLQNSGVVFRFSDGLDGKVPGEAGYFFSEGAITNKTLVTNLYFSKASYYGEQLAELFASVGSNLGDLYLALTQQDDTANYGFFNVVNVIDSVDYYTIEVDLRGNLFAKEFLVEKNYALYFDLASSNEFSISIVAGVFMLYKNGALVDQVDMSVYLDDTNLSRLTSGTVDANGIATFSRDDLTTFTVDFSTFLGGITPTKTSDLTNDGADGITPYAVITRSWTKTESDNKDAVIQLQVTKLNGLYLEKDTVNNKILLKNADGTQLSEMEGYENSGAGYTMEFDSVSKTIYILDADSNVVDSVPISVMVSDKLDKGGYTGTAQTLKDYIDTLLAGLKWKQSVLVATTGNIVLSGEQTIDGTLTSASRVLVKDQTNKIENGIYLSAAGAWARSLDADTGEELLSATTTVEQGEINANINFTCNTTNITVGTTEIVWGFLSDALGVTIEELETRLAEEDDVIGFTDRNSFPLAGEVDKIYINKASKLIYVWDIPANDYVGVGGGGGTAEVHTEQVYNWATGQSQIFTVTDSAKVTDVYVQGSRLAKGVGQEWNVSGATGIEILIPLDNNDNIAIVSSATSTGGDKTDVISYAISSPTADLTAGDTDSFIAPYSFTLNNYFAGVSEAPTGSSLVVGLKKNTVSVTSSDAIIEATETTSLTGTAPVITTQSFLKGDLITPVISQVGAVNTGKSLKIYLEITKS